MLREDGERLFQHQLAETRTVAKPHPLLHPLRFALILPSAPASEISGCPLSSKIVTLIGRLPGVKKLSMRMVCSTPSIACRRLAI